MKILVLSCHTPSLFWFRLDLMKEFINQGHSVVAIGHEPETNDLLDRFNKYGIKYRHIQVRRNGLSIIGDITTFIKIYLLIKKEKPDKILSYQAKTIIYGSLAGRLNKIQDIYSLITGLGTILISKNKKARVIRAIMINLYTIALKKNKKVIFQNPDDRSFFIRKKIVSEKKCVLVNGSGVNLEVFKKAPLPERPAFLLIGRLIKDKGIIEYLDACKIIKKKYPETRCLLVGPFDSNPTALRQEDLDFFINNGIIEYFGEHTDVRPFIEKCSVYVLPSYHEGIPKTVLEAMSMGRPVITTDVPGCRETVEDGKNGFLVPVKDVNALADRMEWFIRHPDNIEKMGQESIKICRERFDVKKVNEVMIEYLNIKE